MSRNSNVYATAIDGRKKRIRKYTLEWTLEASVALIHAVQQSENIWDPNHPYYRDRSEKSRCWDEISEAISIPKQEAILRWNALRGNYLTYLRKENEVRNGNKVRRFNALYSEMTFLDPVIKNEREPRESSVKTSSSPARDSSLEPESESQDTCHRSPTTKRKRMTLRSPPEDHKSERKGMKRMRMYDTLMESTQANDEWAAFGNMIACNARSWARDNLGLARRYKAALSAVCAEFEKEAAELAMDDEYVVDFQ